MKLTGKVHVCRSSSSCHKNILTFVVIDTHVTTLCKIFNDKIAVNVQIIYHVPLERNTKV